MKPNKISFERVLSPIMPDAFFAEYFEQKHLVIKRDDPGYWQGLLTFADIDHVVSTMGLSDPEIKVTRNTDPQPGRHSDTAPSTDASTDAPVPSSDADAPSPATDQDAPSTDRDPASDADQGRITPADYAFETGHVDPVRLARRFAEGGTVILSGLHERLPKLAQYTRALEAVMSCRVQTNIYMTPGGNQGFRPHYDSHDVIVLQLEGTKEWRIYDSPVELPLSSQAFAPGALPIGEETDSFVLEPGDMAYIPRGLAHDAVATDQTSLHITTGLMFRTWADLVAEAAQLMAHKDPAFRRALPPGFANSHYDLDSLAPQLGALLQRLAETAPTRPLLDEFRNDFIATRQPRVGGQLTQVARLDGLTADSRVGAQPDLIYSLTRSEDGAMLLLSCYSAEITLPAHVEEPLRFALLTPEFRVADLPGDLDDDGKQVLIRRLILEGLVQLL